MSRKANAALWIAQGLLALLFLFAGGMKLVTPAAEMAKQMPVAVPGGFLLFIGAAELLGGLGLVLPGLFRLHTELTPVAAAGLTIIMIGATGFTVGTGQFAMAAVPLAIALLTSVVGYGRGAVVRSATYVALRAA